jgi:hypothetical protein
MTNPKGGRRNLEMIKTSVTLPYGFLSTTYRDSDWREDVSGGVVLVLIIQPGYITLQNVIDIIKVCAALLLCEIRRWYYGYSGQVFVSNFKGN